MRPILTYGTKSTYQLVSCLGVLEPCHGSWLRHVSWLKNLATTFESRLGGRVVSWGPWTLPLFVIASRFICLIPKKGNYYFVIKTLNVKIMHTHICSPLSMSLTLSCLCNKLSCFSRITLYIEHAISRRYLSSTRFSLHTLHIFVFAWWLYDTTSKPNLCVRVWRSVNALWEPRQPKTVMSYQGNICKPFRLS